MLSWYVGVCAYAYACHRYAKALGASFHPAVSSVVSASLPLLSYKWSFKVRVMLNVMLCVCLCYAMLSSRTSGHLRCAARRPRWILRDAPHVSGPLTSHATLPVQGARRGTVMLAGRRGTILPAERRSSIGPASRDSAVTPGYGAAYPEGLNVNNPSAMMRYLVLLMGEVQKDVQDIRALQYEDAAADGQGDVLVQKGDGMFGPTDLGC